MTVPTVVGNWIKLQYFGSMTNSKVFGRGNKTLDNIVGQIGVLEDNGGDPRTVVSLQSVRDGKHFVHEPLRLNVMDQARRRWSTSWRNTQMCATWSTTAGCISMHWGATEQSIGVKDQRMGRCSGNGANKLSGARDHR